MPSYKYPLTDKQSLEVLQNKGLKIEDHERVIHYLHTIGYYRLSAYFTPFQNSKNEFCPHLTFDDILSLYIFDRRLRLLALDPLQRIEIAVRTVISSHMAYKYDPYWFLDKNLFENIELYYKFIGIADKVIGRYASYTIGVINNNKKHCDSRLPPSWILIEELPMGTWSKLYANLKNKQDKRAIAENFGFKWHDFKSWLESLTILRNICAHHRPLWNIQLLLRPRNIERYITADAGRVKGSYLNFVIIMAFLKTFIRHPSWHLRLLPLFDICPLDPYAHMGFPFNWLSLPFWQRNA